LLQESELVHDFAEESFTVFWVSFAFLFVFINISSVVEFQRWWVLKSKIFGQESTYSKEKNQKNSVDE
jgi:hypothetical protein